MPIRISSRSSTYLLSVIRSDRRGIKAPPHKCRHALMHLLRIVCRGRRVTALRSHAYPKAIIGVAQLALACARHPLPDGKTVRDDRTVPGFRVQGEADGDPCGPPPAKMVASDSGALDAAIQKYVDAGGKAGSFEKLEPVLVGSDLGCDAVMYRTCKVCISTQDARGCASLASQAFKYCIERTTGPGIVTVSQNKDIAPRAPALEGAVIPVLRPMGQCSAQDARCPEAQVCAYSQGGPPMCYLPEFVLPNVRWEVGAECSPTAASCPPGPFIVCGPVDGKPRCLRPVSESPSIVGLPPQ
jgi:hypothetical protein